MVERRRFRRQVNDRPVTCGTTIGVLRRYTFQIIAAGCPVCLKGWGEGGDRNIRRERLRMNSRGGSKMRLHQSGTVLGPERSAITPESLRCHRSLHRYAHLLVVARPLSLEASADRTGSARKGGKGPGRRGDDRERGGAGPLVAVGRHKRRPCGGNRRALVFKGEVLLQRQECYCSAFSLQGPVMPRLRQAASSFCWISAVPIPNSFLTFSSHILSHSASFSRRSARL